MLTFDQRPIDDIPVLRDWNWKKSKKLPKMQRLEC
jgi:hypothetical protein